MAKPKKKPQGRKKSSKRAAKGGPPPPPQNDVIAEARAQTDPLSSLPALFLEVPLSKPSHGNAVVADPGPPDADDAGAASTAIVRYFASSLPPGLLRQCLELFRTNMGEMYRRSQWGLDVAGKREELQHADARFLVVLAAAAPVATNTTSIEKGGEDATPSSDGAAAGAEGRDDGTVLGFAHLRYERDDDGLLPVTYLYELQVVPSVQRLGIGKKLMTIVELLALRLRTRKVMLTVFHHNEGALRFYRKRRYEVDACSPSNFEGEEEEGKRCDYEILSKSFG